MCIRDSVAAGEVLAIVESNQSMTTYEVTAPISGTIIARDVAPGAAVTAERTIFTIADLTVVWVDLKVRHEDLPSLEAGREITITDEVSGESAVATLSYISPFGSQETQTLRAIASLPNPDGKWRTGLFVRAGLVIEEKEVPVAVRFDALQTLSLIHI